MSWMSALGAWGWAALLAVPPLIVLLYFLKLRRRPVEVPSTYLWKKTLEDLHVNSLWQRLRNNLLMFLQILTVLLVALACLRPSCRSTDLSGNRFIFLVDNSASMSATDSDRGTRLEEAKEKVAALIDQMKPGDLGMLISFSNQAEVVQSYTESQSLLKQKLATISQTQRSTDITEALNAASGLANPPAVLTDDGYQQVTEGKEAALMIVTDGGFGRIDDFTFGNLRPSYLAVGSIEPPVNVGITAFAVNDDLGVSAKREAFAQLRNTSATDQEVDVTLLVEERLFDAKKNVKVPAGRSVGINFPVSGLFEGLGRATRLKLVIETPDVYLQDNVAYAVVNPPRKSRVLVITVGNPYLELALNTEPIQQVATPVFQPLSFLDQEEYQKKSVLGDYDLIIYDRCQPKVMPNCNTVFIDNLPLDQGWKFGERQFPTPLVDVRRSHPLMTTMQLSGVMILEARPVEGPPGTISLLDSTYGSIMAIGPRGGYQDLVIAFPFSQTNEEGKVLVNTDWPSKLSFPLFVQNVVGFLGGGGKFMAGDTIAPGSTAKLRPTASVSKVAIKTPSGATYEISRDLKNQVLFTQTDSCGIYEVIPREYSTPVAPDTQLFAVNLFDPRESDIAVRESLGIGFEEITAERERVPRIQEYWKWLVALAILFLVLEWYVFNRRVLI